MNREDILDRALAIVEAEGAEGLSMRGLGRDLGVSAPALYEHVESKEALLRTLAQQGFAAMAATWPDPDAEPMDWLAATGRAYVRFAVARPALFTVMHRFSPGAIVSDANIEHPSATALFDDGLAHIEAAIDAGDLRADDPLDIAMALWAAAHGVATVSILLPDAGDPEALADRVVGGLLAGLGP